MPRLSKRLILLLAGLCFMPHVARANPWQDLAQSDLRAIRLQIEKNHPGPVDPDNPAFLDWLNNGFIEAEDDLSKVRGLEDYFLILKQYVAGFRDPHVTVDFTSPEVGRKWPGFVVAGREGKVLVVESSTNSPPIGSELISCDGIAVKALLADRVFRFRADPAISASFDAAVRYLFLVADSNLVEPSLQTCRFDFQGRNFDFKLKWRDVSSDALKEFDEAGGNTKRPLSIVKAESGIYWMTLSSFSSDPSNRSALERLFVALNQEQADIAASNGLVIDLRGNSGGSSFFGEILTYLLFDKDTLLHQASLQGSAISVDWRASQDNLNYVRTWLEPGNPRHHSDEGWTKSIILGLSNSVENGSPFFREYVPQPTFSEDPATLPYWRQQKNGSDDKRPVFIPPVPIQAPIFVVTDGACFSACLDFLDLLKQFDGITYLGLPTSADTQYMDTRTVNLPSQLGTLTIPMKVYRDRQRRPGESYVPDIIYEGLDRGEPVFRSWVEKIVAQKVSEAAR
ncbi:S41 family peptidase [Rhizobium lemnae]|uniref:S41 family peptidase n=1 Tax=Rhizobium lemnae TaxID=1214924 RepID=A0ABV8EBU7_9HYPH|nr:S41 family peptidase [Rhizobium lemnae]MCJ8510704.1 S41 family peptidase [Rhizobium lemnae]